MSDYTTANTTSLTLEKFNTEPVMTIHPNGRVTVSDKFKPDEAASKVVDAFKTQWMADVQATKIRELQSDVTKLENRLRALWDKLEGERKYYMERISELEKLGDTLANCTSDNPYNARYAEQWWDLRGIKHE